ncbi:MAG: peptidoglycan bridge formation glycyltransferase FemA/FemB family protein [Patescibacteria group bacterium]
MEHGTWNKESCLNEFLRLVRATAERKGVKFHPENYYRKMIETIPGEILKLYCAEYNNKVIAANLVAFYGNMAIYLHGATDDEYRNIMAPYLLQWQTILDAKKRGCKKYDMGGVKSRISNFQFPISNEIPNSNDQIGKNTKYQILDTKYNPWSGITKFKLGFSVNTKPIEFLGSYDIILNRSKYSIYRFLQNFRRMLS